MNFIRRSFKNNPNLSIHQIVKLIILSVSLFSLAQLNAQENTIVEVTGKVTDEQNKSPLTGVSVNIKGSIAGTITNDSGYFSLRTKLKFPLTLIFTSIGFQPQEFVVNDLNSRLSISLSTQTLLGTEVVVTASRV